MATSMDQLVSEALSLPLPSRAFLAEKLLESLSSAEDFQISDEWKAEIDRRCREFDEGGAQDVSAEQALIGLSET
jgi:putative addiction module component (TIGR02574 family)